MKSGFIMFLILLICSSSSWAQSSIIINFDALMESLKAGDRDRVVIHYALCKWSDKTNQSAVPDAITGMNIDAYEYFAPGVAHNKMAFVVFANTILIQNPKGKGFVYNYGKVRINADNTVVINAKYIHTRTFKVLMDETFAGKLNDGQNGQGVDLFKGK